MDLSYPSGLVKTIDLLGNQAAFLEGELAAAQAQLADLAEVRAENERLRLEVESFRARLADPPGQPGA